MGRMHARMCEVDVRLPSLLTARLQHDDRSSKTACL